MKKTPVWMWLMFGLSAVIAVLIVGLRPASAPKQPPQNEQALVLREKKDHPVTPEMTAAARRMDAKAAPDFALKDVDGKVHSLASLVGDKPLLIFFIEKNCPCCVGAKFFVDKMVDLYPDNLNAIGIINSDAKFGKVWIRTTKPSFPILLDPEMTTIWAYKADRGVYTTLVDKDGRIVKAYPGYSKSSLQELSGLIANLSGVPEKKVISAAAPEEMLSGCAFPSPPKEGF